MTLWLGAGGEWSSVRPVIVRLGDGESNPFDQAMSAGQTNGFSRFQYSEQGTHVAFDIGLGTGADEPVNEFPLFEEKQGRDALSGVAHGGHLVLIHVEFYDLDPARILRSKLIEDR
jgi:hypothetical protein